MELFKNTSYTLGGSFLSSKNKNTQSGKISHISGNEKNNEKLFYTRNKTFLCS